MEDKTTNRFTTTVNPHNIYYTYSIRDKYNKNPILLYQIIKDPATSTTKVIIVVDLFI